MKNAIKAFFIMSVMATSLAYGQSTTNSIYIDQVGDNGNISIVQKGQTNKIGTEQARVILQGDAQTVTVKQEGNNNLITGKVEQADNIDYDINMTGDNNSLNLDQGDGASVAGSKLVLAVTGDSNTLALTQGSTSSATNADQEIHITGDGNAHTSTINADDVKNRVTVVGDNNTATMTQDGFAGKEVTSTVTGNGNTIGINQKSTLNVDKIDITHTGNGNTITINQCNAGVAC
jgi:hypothetical protein